MTPDAETIRQAIRAHMSQEGCDCKQLSRRMGRSANYVAKSLRENSPTGMYNICEFLGMDESLMQKAKALRDEMLKTRAQMGGFAAQSELAKIAADRRWMQERTPWPQTVEKMRGHILTRPWGPPQPAVAWL